MLIREALEQAKAGGRLVAAEPTVEWGEKRREFLMCQPLVSAIEAGRTDSDEKVRQRWAALVAVIGRFVEGGRVDSNLLKQLDPYKYEHWWLRNKRPRPSLRVFGRFALPNVFVGTHVEERRTLGGKWSGATEHQKLVCEDHWDGAGLAGFQPFSDPPDFRYESYITENAKRKMEISR